MVVFSLGALVSLLLSELTAAGHTMLFKLLEMIVVVSIRTMK